jgi:hypothetical protein
MAGSARNHCDADYKLRELLRETCRLEGQLSITLPSRCEVSHSFSVGARVGASKTGAKGTARIVMPITSDSIARCDDVFNRSHMNGGAHRDESKDAQPPPNPSHPRVGRDCVRMGFGHGTASAVRRPGQSAGWSGRVCTLGCSVRVSNVGRGGHPAGGAPPQRATRVGIKRLRNSEPSVTRMSRISSAQCRGPYSSAMRESARRSNTVSEPCSSFIHPRFSQTRSCLFVLSREIPIISLNSR